MSDKRVTLNFDDIAASSEQIQNYALTDQQVTALLSLWPSAAWSTRHAGVAWSQDDRAAFVDELLYALLNPVDCGEGQTDQNCVYYPAWVQAVSYHPANPFTGDPVPAGWLFPPFMTLLGTARIIPDIIEPALTDIFEDWTGYRTTDVFTSYFSLPYITNPFDSIADYPEIRIQVNGTGKITLYLLAVPAGGRALISVDDPPSFVDVLQAIWSPDDRLIDLNRDFVAIPPETDADVIEEIIINTAGAHTIYIQFLPVIQDELLLFQFGGGFRGFELCGNLALTEGDEAVQEGILLTCTDVEDCLPASTTIVNIQNDVTTIQNNITTVQNDITTIENNITNTNTYPPLPDPVTEPDQLCAAAFEIADQLNTLIQDTITDASTITLAEWLNALLLGGGWNSSLLKQLWDFVVVSANPNLSADVTASLPPVRETLYCENLSKSGAIAAINADGSIPADARSAWTGAINATTDSKWLLWAFVGAQTRSEDCNSFCGDTLYNANATGNAFNATGNILEIPVNAGDTVLIEYVSGEWNIGTAWNGSYQGEPGFTSPNAVVPAQNIGALIAMNPDTAAWSYVGQSLTFNVATATYSLYITANDIPGGYVDNSGALKVRVTIT